MECSQITSETANVLRTVSAFDKTRRYNESGFVIKLP